MTATISQDPEPIRRYIDHCVSFLRDARELGASSQTQHDQMLMWSIGLMGAGVFAAYGHLSAHSRCAALAPWAFGILFAIAGRLVGRVVWDRDGVMQLEKIQTLLGLLLMPADTPGLADSARVVMHNEGDFQTRYNAINRLNSYNDALGWVTYILFAIGVVAVFWALA